MRRKAVVVTLGLLLAGCRTDSTGEGAPTEPVDVNALADRMSAQVLQKQFGHVSVEEYTTGGQRSTWDGEYRLRNGGRDGHARIGQADDPTDLIVADGTLFVRFSETQRREAGFPEGGKAWLKYPNKDDVAARILTRTVNDGNVLIRIEEIRAAGTIRETVRENMSGVDTVRHLIDIDRVALDRWHTANTGSLPAGDTQGDGNTLSYQLWLTVDTLPVRLISEYRDREGGGSRATYDYSKWGEPVEITAPPPDQVATPGVPPTG